MSITITLYLSDIEHAERMLDKLCREGKPLAISLGHTNSQKKDPHFPRQRSKGEKARNRRNRHD